MMKASIFFFCIAIVILISFSSCQKEFSCEGCSFENTPPKAIAGPDQVIKMPLDSVWLNGSASNDPDGKIATYLWTKIAGPAALGIVSPGDSSTRVRSLVGGIYQFQLKVTDNGGLSSMDTIQVTVNPLRLETDSVDVYVTSNENGVAKYWKNGQGFELKAKGLMPSIATSIAVDGNDVYVAGWEGDYFDMARCIATYWKNGQEVLLTDKTGTGANAIAVSGTDVYVAGFELKADSFVAVYWKNGVKIALTSGSKYAEATDIAVVGDDVYVSGFEDHIAKCWRNGQLVGPANAANPSYAYGMAILGADVYLAGTKDGKAAYWKNDQAFILSTVESSSHSIFLSGTDVYVAGTQGENNRSVARYWKNGQETILTGLSEGIIANSIFVMGNDVYVTVFEYMTNNRGGYWKNGQFVQLGSRHVYPTDILVKRR